MNKTQDDDAILLQGFVSFSLPVSIGEGWHLVPVCDECGSLTVYVGGEDDGKCTDCGRHQGAEAT